MKYLFLIFALLFVTVARAEPDTQPAATQPASQPTTVEPAREGTKIEISDAEVAEIKQWIQNAKFALNALHDNWRLLNTDDKLQIAKSEFTRIVQESASKSNELYVRYVLNRALVVTEIVGAEPTEAEKQSLLGFYDQSITLALQLYVDDTAYLEALRLGAKPPKALKQISVFGIEYAETLLGYSQTFLNPKIEYQITRSTLGFLGNDLNSPRNLDRLRFTEVVIRIQQLLQIFPSQAKGQAQSIVKDIRKLKYEYREHLKPMIEKSLNDLDLGFAVDASGNNTQAQTSGSTPTSSANLFSDRNFKSCLAYLNRDDGGGAAGLDFCAETSKVFKFDQNDGLKLCFSEHFQDKKAITSLKNCIKLISDKKVRFDANYKKCFDDVYIDHSGSDASFACADLTQKVNLFRSIPFDRCFKDHVSSIGSIRSINICSTDVNKGETFGSNYVACFDYLKNEGPSDVASDRCLVESKSFRFEHNEDFAQCYRQVFQHSSGLESFNSCLMFINGKK